MEIGIGTCLVSLFAINFSYMGVEGLALLVRLVEKK
jgi:hypothetical protein